MVERFEAPHNWRFAEAHHLTPSRDGTWVRFSDYEALAKELAEARPWVSRVGEVLDEGDGFWRSCSGCHELNEGHPTGEYSAAFRTHVGLGCSECGGLGVVWDDTDYAGMGDFLAKEADDWQARAETAESRLSEMEKEVERLRAALAVAEERLSQIDCATIGQVRNTSPLELLNWCKSIASAGLSEIYAARRLVEGDGK